MVGKYDILLNGECVGSADVSKEGLYYNFSCQCTLKRNTVYKLILVSGQKNMTLGIPIPAGNGFVLHKKLPVKHFEEQEYQFHAVPKQVQSEGIFIPIRPEEPFPYLNRLSNACLKRKNGVIGIVLYE